MNKKTLLISCLVCLMVLFLGAKVTPERELHVAIGENASAGNTSFTSSSVTVDEDGSVLERLETLQASQAPSYNHPNYFAVTVDLSNATWSSVAAHEVIEVTGACRIQVLIECTETCTTTSTDTMAFGFAGNTAAIFAATDLDTFIATDVLSAVYGSAGTTVLGGGNAISALTSCIFDFVAVGGIDVGYTIANNVTTNGTLIFHVWWTPLDSTGACIAGSGGAF